MADRKATNKYMPPDFDPQKHGSINKYMGQHPLRERAKRIDEGILIIRFELPYKIWCFGCNETFAMGVRYNAEKRKVGNYFSTPIFSFRMKCHECPNWMVMQTDPQNTQYICVEGCRKKIEEWDIKEKLKDITLQDDEESAKLATNAMYKLENGESDVTKARKSKPRLENIKDVQDSRKDHYAVNRMLRDKFRNEKKANIDDDISQKQIQADKNVSIKVLPINDRDHIEAKIAMLRRDVDGKGNLNKNRNSLRNSSIFGDRKKAAATQRLKMAARSTKKTNHKSTPSSISSFVKIKKK